MSLENRNLAYDLSVFEEVAPKRKKDNIVSLPQKEISEKRAYEQKRAKMVLIIAAAVVSIVSLLVTFTIVNNQIKLTELTSKIQTVEKKITEGESLEVQLKAKNESNFPLSKVEEVAKNDLDMVKTDPSQTEFINVSKGDIGRKIQVS